MNRDDYDLVANAADINSAGLDVLNVSLAHNRDSVQLRMDPRAG